MIAKGCPLVKLARKAAKVCKWECNEYKVQRSELPVGIHKYLRLEYEVQVSHVHYSNVHPKPSVICIKIIKKLISAC